MAKIMLFNGKHFQKPYFIEDFGHLCMPFKYS